MCSVMDPSVSCRSVPHPLQVSVPKTESRLSRSLSLRAHELALLDYVQSSALSHDFVRVRRYVGREIAIRGVRGKRK